jgi:PPK2 family polyphosphate:nucleotide phosphotransferase
MIRLHEISPKAPKELNKEYCLSAFLDYQKELFTLQHLLYASHTHSVLVIFQGMDTSGKDSTIRHVFSCVNPLGCHAVAFKEPNELEKEHDFMWRIFQQLPKRGMMQIFNRSYYEDIIVPSIKQSLEEKILERRYSFINSFEQHLSDNQTVVLKFFLHISKEEQEERIVKRQENPLKRWKYSENDWESSKNWNKYIDVYEKIFVECSLHSNWIIIPSDKKWYRNYLVIKTMVEKLKELNLKIPEAM